MARKIIITSGKGGVGKTTMTALLGVCLAKKGERVALVDADFGLNNLDICVGVEGETAYGLCDVAAGKCRVKQALARHPKYPNLFVLSGGKGDGSMERERFRAVISELDKEFDYILIDCPAGIDGGFALAACVADEGVVVVTPHLSSVRDADKAIQRLKGQGIETLSLLINLCHGDLIVTGEEFSPMELARLLKLPVLGVVPHQYTLPCEEHPTPHISVRYAADILRGGKRKVFDPTKRYLGFFGSLRRKMKRSL
ncbi:MAG: septum site-determining protein MinD [Clostridiales bacterium]|nr:septum site-determining protein MinD [Clostridiales bacterium]MBO5335412.1 AAA family ATPase [Clostridia bacterium]MBQ8352498.1 AAA family ATPase [Clostridia bacterium]